MTVMAFAGSTEQVLQQMGEFIGKLADRVTVLETRAGAAETALHSALVTMLIYNEVIDEGHWTRVIEDIAEYSRRLAQEVPEEQKLATERYAKFFEDFAKVPHSQGSHLTVIDGGKD